MSSLKKVAITTGDIDGIGLEIAVKGLLKIGPQKNVCFHLWRSPDSPDKETKRLKNKFNVVQISDFSELAKYEYKNDQLIEIISQKAPALWVEDVANLCLHKKINSLVTGPLSKQAVLEAGLSDLGHTDILKRVSKSDNAFMGFIGKHFNVILVSSHIPLKSVEKKLTTDLLLKSIKVALESRKILKPILRSKPIGILGLNPHAGDSGLIGDFEQSVLQDLFKSNRHIKGPLVPDVAFIKSNWSDFSYYLALYHDQGLIPFKTVHGFDSGVHLTLGLPIKRTSVDHGTAKDIFGKNEANPGSMIEAIKWGVKLCTIP